MKQVEFQILEQAYVLGCPEGGEDKLNQAVTKVDEAMRSIRDTGKLRSRDRIAVLAALNLAFDHVQLQEEHAQAAAAALKTKDEVHLKDLLKRMEKALGVGESAKTNKRF